MKYTKSINVTLAAHINLSNARLSIIEKGNIEMSNIPYPNVIGSVMFSMIRTRVDLAYEISFLS